MCQARPGLPAVYIMKDYTIVLNSALKDLDLKPCELFGFGIGDFKMQESCQDVESDQVLAFVVPDDLSLVSVVKPDPADPTSSIKDLMPLCSAVCAALHEHNVADVGLQFFELKQQKAVDASGNSWTSACASRSPRHRRCAFTFQTTFPTSS